jgi:uncharacterized protein YbcV (DUF1398 family)
MFTLQSIKEAHAQVKSGADFPQYIQVLKKSGVSAYENYVADGHTQYFGSDNFKITSDPKYTAIPIASESSIDTLKHDLGIHQQGGTDYLTFCKQAAKAGVHKWTVDIINMTCTYYNKAGTAILVESIPVP